MKKIFAFIGFILLMYSAKSQVNWENTVYGKWQYMDSMRFSKYRSPLSIDSFLSIRGSDGAMILKSSVGGGGGGPAPSMQETFERSIVT